MKKKTRTGSPSLGLGASFAVQLFAEDLAVLERMARDQRASKGAILRGLVRQALDQNFAAIEARAEKPTGAACVRRRHG